MADKLDTAALISQLKAVIAQPDSVGNEAKRQELLSLARSASIAIEQPLETVLRLAYGPLLLTTARIARQYNIFATLTASKDAVSLERLQDASQLAPVILEPIVEYLCSQDMVTEAKPGLYTATKQTHVMMAPVAQDAITHFYGACLPAFGALNDSIADGSLAFKKGVHSDEDFYTWLESHPVQGEAFHRFMEAQWGDLPTWLDVFDFAKEMGQGLTTSDVAFVDVGGGQGQQCAALKAKYPALQGRIVLQEKPKVLERSLSVDGMEKMSYDYLTKQPVKGARVYYFRQILHNNDDASCIQLLKAQIPAMSENSVIIIDDKTLSDEKQPQDKTGLAYTAGLNIAMKAMFNAQERRASEWKELIAKTGLVIREVRMFSKVGDSAIVLAKA